MRIINSTRNIVYALSGQLISYILNFVLRAVFINTLGIEYLGLNGLFTNILSTLSLAELGIGGSIVFCLYKPLAENDEDKIKSLMNLFCKLYRVIGCVVLSIGILLTPILPYLIKEIPRIKYINLIYILFVINSSITYFAAYKRSLIIADQKNYIVSKIHYIIIGITYLLQMMIIITTKNYILYLVIQIVLNLTENLIIHKKADAIYPFLKDKYVSKIDLKTKNTILNNIKSIALYQIGGIINNSTDNIIISSVVGVQWVGYYSNYLLLISGVNAILGQILGGMTASIGNLNVKDSDEKQYFMYKIILYISFSLFIIISTVLLNTINMFIVVWLGEGYKLTNDIVFIIVLNLFLLGTRYATFTFKNTKGLFVKDKYMPILGGAINLFLSIYIGKKIGIKGVLMGTTISWLLTLFWSEPYVLYKYGFNKNIKEYILIYIKYISIFVIGILVTSKICSVFETNSIINLIIRSIFTIVITLIINLAVFWKSFEFKYIISALKQLLKFRIKNSYTNI